MNFKKLLSELLAFALPYLKKLIESKIVPALKRKAYQRLDDFANDRIEDLSELLEKIKKTDNEEKKKRHLEGFRLGVEALIAIGEKLQKAGELLAKEI